MLTLMKEYCELNSNKYSFYGEYAPDFMEGETCPGIIVKDENSPMSAMIDFAFFLEGKGYKDVNCEFEGAAIAQMDSDSIVYFPWCGKR